MYRRTEETKCTSNIPQSRGRVKTPTKNQRARSSSSNRTRRASNRTVQTRRESNKTRRSLNDVKVSLIAADMIISDIMTHIPHTGSNSLELKGSPPNHIKSLSKIRDSRGKRESRAEQEHRRLSLPSDSRPTLEPNLQVHSNKGREERGQLHRPTSSSDSRTTSLSSDSPVSSKPSRILNTTQSQQLNKPSNTDKQGSVDLKTARCQEASRMRRMYEPTLKANKEREGRKVNAPIRHHSSPSNNDTSKRVS